MVPCMPLWNTRDRASKFVKCETRDLWLLSSFLFQHQVCLTTKNKENKIFDSCGLLLSHWFEGLLPWPLCSS